MGRAGIVAATWLLCSMAAGCGSAVVAEDYPLSLQLQVLERDLESKDYHDVLKTMISTDLAAEWQRVATTDNYHLFAKQHGGLDKVKADPALQAAYERRKQIADKYLALMREVCERKKAKMPFSDEATLVRVLESAASGTGKKEMGEIPVR